MWMAVELYIETAPASPFHIHNRDSELAADAIKVNRDY
jgi:hypothetical protein